MKLITIAVLAGAYKGLLASLQRTIYPIESRTRCPPFDSFRRMALLLAEPHESKYGYTSQRCTPFLGRTNSILPFSNGLYSEFKREQQATWVDVDHPARAPEVESS